MVDKKYLFRLALNQSGDSLPMAGAEYETLEDQQVEGALQQGNAFVVTLLGSHSTQVSARSGRMSTQAVNRSEEISVGRDTWLGSKTKEAAPVWAQPLWFQSDD
jgi:hypothetical protein